MRHWCVCGMFHRCVCRMRCHRCICRMWHRCSCGHCDESRKWFTLWEYTPLNSKSHCLQNYLLLVPFPFEEPLPLPGDLVPLDDPLLIPFPGDFVPLPFPLDDDGGWGVGAGGVGFTGGVGLTGGWTNTLFPFPGDLVPFPFPLPGDLVPLLPGDLVPFPILCMVDMVEEDIIFYIRNKKRQRATVSISSTRSSHHWAFHPRDLLVLLTPPFLRRYAPSTGRSMPGPRPSRWWGERKHISSWRWLIQLRSIAGGYPFKWMIIAGGGRIWRGDQEKDMENPCETNEDWGLSNF